jgi:hypothetical protein
MWNFIKGLTYTKVNGPTCACEQTADTTVFECLIKWVTADFHLINPR